MIDTFPCPVIGCPHYPDGPGKKFTTIPSLIRHLKGEDHNNSRLIINQTLCNKINLYRCTHHTCSTSQTNFFSSKRAYEEHLEIKHPPNCPISNRTIQDNEYDVYTNIIYHMPGQEELPNKWNEGIPFITTNFKS